MVIFIVKIDFLRFYFMVNFIVEIDFLRIIFLRIYFHGKFYYENKLIVFCKIYIFFKNIKSIYFFNYIKYINLESVFIS